MKILQVPNVNTASVQLSGVCSTLYQVNDHWIILPIAKKNVSNSIAKF